MVLGTPWRPLRVFGKSLHDSIDSFVEILLLGDNPFVVVDYLFEASRLLAFALFALALSAVVCFFWRIHHGEVLGEHLEQFLLIKLRLVARQVLVVVLRHC